MRSEEWGGLLTFIISGVLVVGAVIGLTGWFEGAVERPVVDIEAALDVPEQGLPVYAQFVVTQRLMLRELVRVSELVVPLYAPEDAAMLQVDLRVRGELVYRWRYVPTASSEVVHARLPMEPPQLLGGEVEVVFVGKHIGHEEKDRAARLFIEPAALAYPDGGYRIANNEKEGNVSLQVIERKTQWEAWQESWQENASGQMIKITHFALVILLLSSLPVVVFRFFRDLTLR